MVGQKRKIAVWGAGKRGRLLAYSNMKIDFFIDNDVSKRGSLFCEKKVVHPTDIVDWTEVYIVIPLAPHLVKQVCEQLKSYGLTENEDFEVWKEFLVCSKERVVQDFKEKMESIDSHFCMEAEGKKVLYWGSMEHLDKIYTRDFLKKLSENENYKVISLIERGISLPVVLHEKLYIEDIEKGAAEKINIPERELLVQIAQQMEADTKIEDYDAFFVKTYYGYQYLLKLFDIMRPQLIICNDSVNPIHRLIRNVARIKCIPIIFMHQGVLPGTISFDVDGEVGESLPALYASGFKALNVTDKDKETAKKVLHFLKESKLNRKEQPKSDLNEIYSRLDPEKKTVFYCGQNDARSYMVPYTKETKRYYSPIFESTFDGLCYIAELCEKNGWNLLFKPHPMYIREAEIAQFPRNVIYVEKADINDIIDLSDVVVTILSSTNYIAMIREKPVVMLGYNWTRENGCTYEAYGREEVEMVVRQAIEEGYTQKQKEAFLFHVSRCLKYYVYDDMKPRELRYGKRMPETVEAFYELKNKLLTEE